jgi:hypothetical protein
MRFLLNLLDVHPPDKPMELVIPVITEESLAFILFIYLFIYLFISTQVSGAHMSH